MTRRRLNTLLRRWFPCLLPGDCKPTRHVNGCPALQRGRAERLVQQIVEVVKCSQ